MKSKILLLAFLAAAFTSCTTAYKTGQTPDDVYYSPARPQEEYVQTDKEDDRQYRNQDDEYYDNRYLRMKVKDRYRWSDLDDSYYYSRRYSYSKYDCSCVSNPWTPYSYWNNYYNPYNHNYTIVSPSANTTYTKPRTFNLNSYNSQANTNSNTNSNTKYNSGNNSSNNNTYSAPRNSNAGKNDNSGTILRDIFSGGNKSNSNSSGSSSNNNNSSSSSSSSSSGSSSGTTAPVRKF